MRRVTILAAALSLIAASAARAAVTVGISDQQSAALTDQRLLALKLRHARLIVPYDAATTEPAAVQAWLDAASAGGMQPHVAFEHRRGERCPASPCTLPSKTQYAAAVQAFVARFPQVRAFTTWNEANHEAQPTAQAPEAVAGYYAALRAACSDCTIVAGDVIDSGAYVSWLRRFAGAANGAPQLWGLHNYTDVTFGTTSGTDAALSAVSGELWLEETGGIVVRRDTGGRELLASDEARAARAIDQAFAIAAGRPRITRMYVYQWQARPRDTFDAGLVRPDGVLRPSYTHLVTDLKGLTSPTAARSAPALTWSASWSATRARTLLVRARCAGSCRGTVHVSLRTLSKRARRTTTVRLATRRAYRTTTAVVGQTLRVRVSKARVARARRAARRSIVLTVSPQGAASRRVLLTLRRPR